MDNPQILLHHLLQEYLVERDINFTEMLTSNVQLGYVLTRVGGGGEGGRVGSCPSRFILPPSPTPSRISNRMDNQQILLHHLLQEKLVERDINFFSINLRCLLQTFSWVTYLQGMGGQAVQGSLSCPPPPAQNFNKPAWTACPPPLRQG